MALTGRAILAALKAADRRAIVALPDIVTSDGLLWPVSRDPDFQLVRIAKEDEGVAICAGFGFGGGRALLMMQQTGLMDSLNAIRGIAMDYRQPIAMLVGLQGKEPDLEPAQSASYGVRIIQPVLDAMGIAHHLIQDDDDVPAMGPALAGADHAHAPVVFLIGRPPLPGPQGQSGQTPS